MTSLTFSNSRNGAAVDKPAQAPAGPHPKRPHFDWDDADAAAENYARFGKSLAGNGDLFRNPRYGDGLILLLADKTTTSIRKGSDLAGPIVDRVDLAVFLDGKTKGNRLSAAHLNSILRSEAFLENFPTIDCITAVPMYMPDFSLTQPGFSDGGPGARILYTGDTPLVLESHDRTDAFLRQMDFASQADRTNALAAAVTVVLRNHFIGGKPVFVATGSKSHSGKDTVILFAAGECGQCSVSYQSTDWAVERCFVGALNANPDIGVVVIENARLGRHDHHISSAFVERFITDPAPFLFSTGSGPPVRRRNDIVVAISTNFGNVSEDLLNRALPCHLEPAGDINDRESPIGNPKLEYLPTYRSEIAAEIRGMIEKWKAAGMPRDTKAKHPFTEWAAVVGGILRTNGYEGFLANYGTRRIADDPIRKGIALLGASLSGATWRRPAEWARQVSKMGLVNQVIPAGDRGTGTGIQRGIGVVLSTHRDERFDVETESQRLSLRLEKRRGRFDEAQVHTRYRFVVVDSEELAEDSEPVGDSVSNRADNELFQEPRRDDKAADSSICNFPE